MPHVNNPFRIPKQTSTFPSVSGTPKQSCSLGAQVTSSLDGVQAEQQSLPDTCYQRRMPGAIIPGSDVHALAPKSEPNIPFTYATYGVLVDVDEVAADPSEPMKMPEPDTGVTIVEEILVDANEEDRHSREPLAIVPWQRFADARPSVIHQHSRSISSGTMSPSIFGDSVIRHPSTSTFTTMLSGYDNPDPTTMVGSASDYFNQPSKSDFGGSLPRSYLDLDRQISASGVRQELPCGPRTRALPTRPSAGKANQDKAGKPPRQQSLRVSQNPQNPPQTITPQSDGKKNKKKSGGSKCLIM